MLWMPAHTDPDFLLVRKALLTREAWQQCPPTGPPEQRTFRDAEVANARGALEEFVSGETLEETFDLKRLDPEYEAIWALRVVEAPQVRLFGWFVERDTMIISHAQSRDALGRGERGHQNFAAAVQKAMRKRDGAFSDLPHMNALGFHAYISNGVSDDFRED